MTRKRCHLAVGAVVVQETKVACVGLRSLHVRGQEGQEKWLLARIPPTWLLTPTSHFLGPWASVFLTMRSRAWAALWQVRSRAAPRQCRWGRVEGDLGE